MEWFSVLLTSLPWAMIVGILLYFIKNPEKAEKWSSIIARSLSFLSSRIEKFSVARDIQSDINAFAKKVRIGINGSFVPYDVKISWVKSITKETFIKNGKVVVKMERHENQARNFLCALMEWVNKGLIPESRQFLDKSILQAVDLVFVNKALTESKRHDSRQIFFDEVFEPKVVKGSLVERYCSVFGNLDKVGLFLGVVLPEYASLGKRLGSTIPDEKIRLETIYFFNMLERLSRRRKGQDTNPNYVGEYINCCIVLIARIETYTLYGLEPYLSFINKRCKEGARSFYVCAIGDPNISVVRRIKDSYEGSQKLSFVWEKISPWGGTQSIVLHLEARD